MFVALSYERIMVISVQVVLGISTSVNVTETEEDAKKMIDYLRKNGEKKFHLKILT